MLEVQCAERFAFASARRLCLLQTQRVHPPAVADGVEEPAAAGGTRVTARHMGGAVLHQAAAATRRVHRVCLVTLRKHDGGVKVIFPPNKQVRLILTMQGS